MSMWANKILPTILSPTALIIFCFYLAGCGIATDRVNRIGRVENLSWAEHVGIDRDKHVLAGYKDEEAHYQFELSEKIPYQVVNSGAGKNRIEMDIARHKSIGFNEMKNYGKLTKVNDFFEVQSIEMQGVKISGSNLPAIRFTKRKWYFYPSCILYVPAVAFDVVTFPIQLAVAVAGAKSL